MPKIVTSHRAMSYVTPHLSITPGTCTLSLTRTTSLSSDPLLGELQPCADLRQLERGSVAEPHPSQCVDGMVAPGGYALPSGPGHVHVDWTLNCIQGTTVAVRTNLAWEQQSDRSSRTPFGTNSWNWWSRAASFVTPWCLKKEEPSGVNLEWDAAWGSFSCGTAITNPSFVPGVIRR